MLRRECAQQQRGNRAIGNRHAIHNYMAKPEKREEVARINQTLMGGDRYTGTKVAGRGGYQARRLLSGSVAADEFGVEKIPVHAGDDFDLDAFGADRFAFAHVGAASE